MFTLQDKVASVAMRRSIQGMLEELEPNLWEHVLCRLVDYGHTFSPEIEMAALTQGDELLHGEAVNIDMALTTQVKPRASQKLMDFNPPPQLSLTCQVRQNVDGVGLFEACWRQQCDFCIGPFVIHCSGVSLVILGEVIP